MISLDKNIANKVLESSYTGETFYFKIDETNYFPIIKSEIILDENYYSSGTTFNMTGDFEYMVVDTVNPGTCILDDFCDIISTELISYII